VTTLSSDPLDILIRHNTWAMGVLLEHCLALTPEQFHQDFGIGPGSLHDNITHTLATMMRWIDRIEGKPLRPRLDGRKGPDDPSPPLKRSVDELLDVLRDGDREWQEALPRMRPRLGEVLEIGFPGSAEKYRFTVAAAIVHVTNHGMHHRAQCLYMLKRLGVSPLPELDELHWQTLGEPDLSRRPT
jgi:uncharacterized damage-inducible protein DinB